MKIKLLIPHKHHFVPCHVRPRILFCAVLLFLCERLPAQVQPLSVVKIQVDPRTVVSHISPDFIGLGYETSAAAQSNYFSAKDTTLIQLYRNLSTHGLIRIGGIISDHTRYVPDGTPAAHDMKQVTVINQANLRDLGDFTRATGWRVMWGLNLGHGTKAEAVEEALAVDKALGSSLHSFQIGNEVEGLRHGYEAYHKDYLAYKAGIRAVLPNAPFSGPDSVGNWLYISNFAATESQDLKLLTRHYYRSGAGNKNATLEWLLQRDEGWDRQLDETRALARQYGLSYRINEVNSFSGGGKKDVSDTFGSALWALDYLFILTSYGCEGVNIQTDINQLGFISHYSPIVHDAAGDCSVRPEYYGLLAFSTAGNGDLVKLTLDKGGLNLSAYAALDDQGYLWVAVINKDEAGDARVEISLPLGYSRAGVDRLLAPSIDSKDQVTFASAKVSAQGSWTPKSPAKLAVTDGVVLVQVPHASAALVRLQP